MNRENNVVLTHHLVYIPFEEIWLIEGKHLANNETSHIVHESTSICRVPNK